MLVATGVVIAVAVATAGVAFLFYDKATKLDRTTPAVALEQYAWSTLYDLDNGRAKLFVCHQPQLGDVATLQQEFIDRERKYGTKVTFDLANEEVSVAGDTATINVDLKVLQTTSAGVSAESSRPWTFGLRNESGWRVCSGHPRS